MQPTPYDAVLGGFQKQYVTITFRKPKDCFFNYVADIYSPGWFIGEIKLPCSADYRGNFYLIRDLNGETHWIPFNRVLFRGQTHRFDSAQWQDFNWNQIEQLNKLPINYQKPTAATQKDF